MGDRSDSKNERSRFQVQKKPAEAGLNESTLRAAHECSLPNERMKVTGAKSQSATSKI